MFAFLLAQRYRHPPRDSKKEKECRYAEGFGGTREGAEHSTVTHGCILSADAYAVKPACWRFFLTYIACCRIVRRGSSSSFDPMEELVKTLFESRNLYLVGFMGSGKSKQSKILAERLGRTAFEMDARIRELFDGMEIPEIFRVYGEPRFRAVETDVVRETLRRRGLVVSCGGGTFCQTGLNPNREIMIAKGVVVWLDVSFEIVSERLKKKTDRPKWNPEDMAKNKKLFEDRLPYYKKADYRIPIVDELRPEEVADRIMEAIS